MLFTLLLAGALCASLALLTLALVLTVALAVDGHGEMGLRKRGEMSLEFVCYFWGKLVC